MTDDLDLTLEQARELWRTGEPVEIVNKPEKREEERMFVVEVDVVKQWMDRGGTSWVTVGILADRDANDEDHPADPVEVDVKPEDLYQLQRSLVQVHD